MIRNGAGPTLCLGAGNHGDEYEGQIEVRFEAAGLVICRRPILQVERGDCLGHLATELR